MKNCVGRGQKLVWFWSNFSIFVRNSFCRWHSNEKIDSKILFNVYSFEGCVGMTLIFCSHMALWWVKKETLHIVLSFGKIALSKLLQNVESPFRGAAPLKAHIAPQDPAAPHAICRQAKERGGGKGGGQDLYDVWNVLIPYTHIHATSHNLSAFGQLHPLLPLHLRTSCMNGPLSSRSRPWSLWFSSLTD